METNPSRTDSGLFTHANLNVGDLLRPTGIDKLTVNATDTKAYADSSRTRNFWYIENQFFDVNDPTHNTLRYDYTGCLLRQTNRNA